MKTTSNIHRRFRRMWLLLGMMLVADLSSAHPAFSSGESGDPAVSANLMVVITGATGEIGNLCIALYAEEEGGKTGRQEDRKPAYRTAVIPVQSGLGNHQFDTIPFGTYAIMAFHDANANMQLNTDKIGKPTEVYGFSPNARGTLGPPAFKDALFPFHGSQQIETMLK